ncbi:MAG: hypothetical protein GX557_15770 [Chloroflexi bacterium]|nr:hypothetical protein [Chloroflexota bacterium]
MSMWQLRISTKSRSSRKLLLGALIVGCLLAASLPVAADASIVVVSAENSYRFSESLTFELQVRSTSPLSEVVLFYGRVKAPLVRRIYPEVPTGTEATLRYEEELERGQFAPGTVFRVWWELRNAAGEVLVTEPVTFEYAETTQDWQMLSGERVDLYWYGNREQAAREYMQVAEAALTRLEIEIGVGVGRRVKVYVYNSDRDMSVAVASRSDSYDAMTTTLGVAVDDDTMLLLGSDSDADITLAHELSHIVVGIATDNPYSAIPRWLDEGLAMNAQGRLDTRNERALERAIEADALLSIRSMSSYSGKAEEVDLWYAEAYSVVSHMLDEYGPASVRELLTVFSAGAHQEDALRQVLGIGLDDLDRQWRTSLGLGPRRTATPAPAAAHSAATPVPTQPEPAARTESGRPCGALLGALVLPLGGLALTRGLRGGVVL